MATLKLFVCQNPKCQPKDGGKFMDEDPKPSCPQCGMSKKDSKFGDVVIVRCSMVHFDPPSIIPGIGENVRACDKTKPIAIAHSGVGMPNPWHAGTGNPAQVSCPACKETPEWKAVMKQAEDDEDDGPTAAALERLRKVGGKLQVA